MIIISLAREIKSVQKGSKVDYDGILTHFIFRPCSYYYAAFLYYVFKLTPNNISILTALLSVLSLLIAWFYPSIILLSALLFSIACLDNADGALARYLGKTGPIGELADAFGGYVVVFCMPILTWVMLVESNHMLTVFDLMLCVCTLLCIAFEFFGRSMFLKMKMANYTTNLHSYDKNTNKRSTLSNIKGNLNFCGLMYPVFIFSWFINMPIIAWQYSIILSIFTGLIGFISTIKCILRY